MHVGLATGLVSRLLTVVEMRLWMLAGQPDHVWRLAVFPSISHRHHPYRSSDTRRYPTIWTERCSLPRPFKTGTMKVKTRIWPAIIVSKPVPNTEIRALREGLGLSRRKFAWLLQTQDTAIAAVERGSRPVPKRWEPWLDVLARAGPDALERALPSFPNGRRQWPGNVTAAWRTLLLMG